GLPPPPPGRPGDFLAAEFVLRGVWLALRRRARRLARFRHPVLHWIRNLKQAVAQPGGERAGQHFEAGRRFELDGVGDRRRVVDDLRLEAEVSWQDISRDQQDTRSDLPGLRELWEPAEGA